MLTEPLPTILDVRKAAVRGAGVSGVLKPENLKRFRSLLSQDEGDISVEMTFSRDEENRFVAHVVIEADIAVTCQRCLEVMPKHLSSESSLGIVWTDEEAAQLPRHLDPLVVLESSYSLWDLVEDELILALPPFNYHDTEDCKKKISAFFDPVPADDTGEGKPNPFNVLGHLMPRNKQ